MGLRKNRSKIAFKGQEELRIPNDRKHDTEGFQPVIFENIDLMIEELDQAQAIKAYTLQVLEPDSD